MFNTLLTFDDKFFSDIGKILISYSPNGIFPLDTNSEKFYTYFIKKEEINLITQPGKYINGEWKFLPYGNYIWEGEIHTKENLIYINGDFLSTTLFELEDGLNRSKKNNKGQHLCGYCDNVAKYNSMDFCSDFYYKSYFCEDCVPKSDSIDYEYKDNIDLSSNYKTTDGVFLSGNILENYVISMTDNDYLIPLDKNGEEYPSSLMFVSEDGFLDED